MYTRKLKCRIQKWSTVFQSHNHLFRSPFVDHVRSQSLSCATLSRNYHSPSFVRRFLSNCSSCHGVAAPNSLSFYANHNSCLSNSQLRFFSSEGDGRNASGDKQEPVKDDIGNTKGKSTRVSERTIGDASHVDVHARLGEQDQKEWLHNEKLSIESKKQHHPFLGRREKFKSEFLRRIVPWDKINVSWETFPYHIHEHTKNVLMECAASHLKNKKFNTSYGARLSSSSGRILLQSVPGTELFRERLVRALAQDLQVPLLVLDSSVLAPYDFGDECSYDSEDENAECTEDSASGSDIEDGNDATAEAALKKLIPYNLEEFEKRVSGESESEASKPEDTESSEKLNQPLKKGDRVKYVGPARAAADNKRIELGRIQTSDGPTKAYTVISSRPLSTGQRGVVYEVAGDQVAIILDISEGEPSEAEKDSKIIEQPANPSVHWIDVKDVQHDIDGLAEDCYIAMDALYEVLESVQPLIVYFPDSSQWLSRAVPKSDRENFIQKVQTIFGQLSGPVVLICGQNKVETSSKEKEKFTMILPNLGHLAKLPLSLKRLTEGMRATKRSDDKALYKLFNNVLTIEPPQEEDLLRTFNKQLEADRKIVISRSNLNELHQVLEEHELSCMELLHINTDGVLLTRQKAEKVVGWAKNHYLSSCSTPSIKGDRLYLPRGSLEISIQRLKDQESVSQKPSQNLKNLAKDDYEKNFVSALVPPGEIGVKFDDVGALEDVKNALHELVILPMRRPELFSHGNLLRPCKGILLFGPPGTGKTLLAKALATEAGANFISITGSTLTSKWFGDAEKLTKALFSFATRLAPVIIFVDEVDSLLGARGSSHEHEATRRMRNEFMAAWDGLRSKDSQRILILGATNRPFDLDDAVIRRLPRRIYVDLPDAENRKKILQIMLAQEILEPGFEIEKLANATDGYSGSDLKNLCIAAAYRPVQELLEKEKQGHLDNDDTAAAAAEAASVLRPLNLDDFIASKSKVAPSVAYDASSMNELRKWNEQYGEGGSRRKSPFGF